MVCVPSRPGVFLPVRVLYRYVSRVCVPAPPGVFLRMDAQRERRSYRNYSTIVDGFGRNSMAAVVDATSVPVLSTLHGRQHPESVPAPSHGRYQLILTLVWLSDESLRKRRGPTAV